MSIEVDTWGTSDITGVDEDGSVSLTLGSHGGEPLFLELKCHTGRDVGRYDDVSVFVEPLYAILFEVLQANSRVEIPPRE